MPTMTTTITLNEAELREAVADYLKGKRYEVKGLVGFTHAPNEAGIGFTTATATVEPIPRKKRGDGKEDDAAK